MKTIFPFKSKFSYCILFGLGLLLSVVRLNATVYTGEELFKGVFFGTGPVAALVPELYAQGALTNQPPPNIPLLVSNLTAQASALSSNGYAADATKLLRLAQRIAAAPTNTPPASFSSVVQSNMVTQIALSDPTFFARFGTNIQSGNEVLVAAAVKEGAERVWQYVDLRGDSDFFNNFYYCLNNINSIDLNQGTGCAVVLVVLVAAVVVFVALWTPAAPGASQYTFESKISLLTARLNAAGPQGIPTISEWGMIILLAAIVICGCVIIVRMQRRREAGMRRVD